MLYRKRPMRTKNYKQFKKKLLKDREIKRAYEKLEPEFDLIKMIIRKRIEKGLTQKELARKIGTKQSAVSRLESGTYNPTISFLEKVAEALDARLKISLSKK
ncbi:MAG: helix-turn-helix domain-containing protein [Candidatus Helarchaeota archaeon]